MRILHFSDVHLSAPWREAPLRDWMGKRLIGGLNLAAGRGAHFADAAVKVEALAAFTQAEAIDAAIFSGDFTAFGTLPELAVARAAFVPFIELPLGLTIVPGNHDLYVPDTVRESRFEAHFGDLLTGDWSPEGSDGPWPLVRDLGDHAAVVAVNSARPNPQPWRSSGEIPCAQLEALARTLVDPRLAGRYLFLVTHYAPRLADGTPDRPSHGLVNAEVFLEVVANVPRGTILCGHVHLGYRVHAEGVAPPIHCAGSATYAGRESFWLFEIGPRTGGDGEVGVRVRRGAWDGAAYGLVGAWEPLAAAS